MGNGERFIYQGNVVTLFIFLLTGYMPIKFICNLIVPLFKKCLKKSVLIFSVLSELSLECWTQVYQELGLKYRNNFSTGKVISISKKKKKKINLPSTSLNQWKALDKRSWQDIKTVFRLLILSMIFWKSFLPFKENWMDMH